MYFTRVRVGAQKFQYSTAAHDDFLLFRAREISMDRLDDACRPLQCQQVKVHGAPFSTTLLVSREHQQNSNTQLIRTSPGNSVG